MTALDQSEFRSQNPQFYTTYKRGPLSDYLSVCDVGVPRSNGTMQVGLVPGHIVLDGDPAHASMLCNDSPDHDYAIVTVSDSLSGC